MTPRNILITGGDGALGSYCDFGMRMSRDEFDITDLNAVMKMCAEKKPKAIVHCAALTDLSHCEKNHDKAYMVNAAGTYHMALGARSVGAKLVYISTSDVFDGGKKEPYTEKDIPNPTTAYGRSKHLGELAVAGILDDYVIMRISWMFGGGPGKDNKFVGKLLAQGEVSQIRAVTDKRASPSWGKDIAGAIQKLIEEDARNIYHVGGGVATKYEIAQELVSIMGWKTKVVPAVSSEFPSAYTIGENESMPLSPLVRPWEDALREYIETEWKG
jgi:dTDP-4-dehydrorhamnose reductase